MNATLVEPVEPLETWFESTPRPHPDIQPFDIGTKLGAGKYQIYAAKSGSLVSYPIEDVPAYSTFTTSHHGGTVLWPALLPFENSLRWRESAQRLRQLQAAQVAGIKPTFPRHVADSLDPAVAFQALRYLRAQPKCPLVALVFAAMVKPLGPVEQVICQGEADELKIWTIVNRATEAQRYAIYDRQWDVMQVFKGSAVDFHMVDREDSSLDGLMEWSDRAYIIAR